MLAPEFINLLYGPKWGPAVPLFRALLLFGLANVIMMFSNCLLLSTGRPSILPKITLARIVLVVLLLLSVMRISLLARCVGISAVQVVLLFAQLSYIRSVYRVPVRSIFAAMQMSTALSLVMVASIHVSVRLLEGMSIPSVAGLAVKVGTGFLVYMSLFAAFKRDAIHELLVLRQEAGS